MDSPSYGKSTVLFDSTNKKTDRLRLKPSTWKVKSGHQRRRNGSLTQINREESCTPVSSDIPTRLAKKAIIKTKNRNKIDNERKLYYSLYVETTRVYNSIEKAYSTY